ncbi:hypothetical protein [uncultured Sulfitobacter sp.]|uniref:hypothetical protein n=1 Tax=uncultured Sulfitobacter sp. TaxID=191468 RepID=UPI002615EEAE|nr:hypothetical protein [uncultured Sulfitobacter sp.]
MKKSFILVVAAFVAGCGGSSPGADYTPLAGAGTTTLDATVAGATVVLDRDANTLSYNGEVGQINAAGDSVVFPSGATMSLRGLGNTQSRLFTLNGAEQTFGAFGNQTAPGDLPISGTASYDGESVLVVAAPEGVFDLTGDVTATIDFRADNATVTFNNLSGTVATGLASPSSVDDFGSVVVSDVAFDDGGLLGGSTVVSTNASASFDGPLYGGVDGAVFGENAEEVAGALDVTGDGVVLKGGFIASK